MAREIGAKDSRFSNTRTRVIILSNPANIGSEQMITYHAKIPSKCWWAKFLFVLFMYFSIRFLNQRIGASMSWDTFNFESFELCWKYNFERYFNSMKFKELAFKGKISLFLVLLLL